MEKRLYKLNDIKIQQICKKMDVNCNDTKYILINNLLEPLVDVYHNVIVELQEDTLNLFVRDINAKKYFTRDDLNKKQIKVYDKLYKFLKKYNIRDANQIDLQDGAKKTLIIENVPEVFKIYKSKGVYDVEKKAYSKIKEKGVQEYFVSQYDFDNDSLTAIAEKIESNQPKYKDSREEILKALESKGMAMTDLKYGDNIGHISGKDVVFDVKSLKLI